MPSREATFLQRAISIPEIAQYHQDVESSLRLYFTPENPSGHIQTNDTLVP